jgi:hypothetical protein
MAMKRCCPQPKSEWRRWNLMIRKACYRSSNVRYLRSAGKTSEKLMVAGRQCGVGNIYDNIIE